MKNGLSQPAVIRLSSALQPTCPDFNSERFCADALKGLETLELKERVSHLIGVLSEHLPKNFAGAADVLRKTPSFWDAGEADDPLSGFAAWPLIDYVGVYGLDHPQTALPLLQTLTPLFSAEFAIRPFIERHTELTLEFLAEWCGSSDPHVRRLVSEGSRPRLPWAPRLRVFEQNPEPILTLLERLKDDPSDYVRRSVANHLNDLSKDEPNLVLALCRKWLHSATKERIWIVRHATRTLVKSGHPEVFLLLGCTDSPRVHIRKFKITPPAIRVGESIELSFEVVSTAGLPQAFVVDYAVHLVKKNGEQRPKVFKLKSVKLAPGETISIQKQHSFKQVTTRVYYPGEQTVELLINGIPVVKKSFRLKV